LGLGLGTGLEEGAGVESGDVVAIGEEAQLQKNRVADWYSARVMPRVGVWVGVTVESRGTGAPVVVVVAARLRGS